MLHFTLVMRKYNQFYSEIRTYYNKWRVYASLVKEFNSVICHHAQDLNPWHHHYQWCTLLLFGIFLDKFQTLTLYFTNKTCGETKFGMKYFVLLLCSKGMNWWCYLAIEMLPHLCITGKHLWEPCVCAAIYDFVGASSYMALIQEKLLWYSLGRIQTFANTLITS